MSTQGDGMAEVEDLVVTIEVDTSRFDAAMKRAIELVNAFAPVAWRIKLARQRRRSRVVTRNKQRRSW